QAKLLRVIQERRVRALGGVQEEAVDVRLVSATHRDLTALVQAGQFRQDLYYRLNVIPIRLPSLRERREDIRALALHFVNRANQTHERNVHLAPEAMARLETHDWPGNIRELGNLIERLVLLTDHTRVTAVALERFMPESLTPLPATEPPPGRPLPAGTVREYLSARSHSPQTLQDALLRHQGNQTQAAQSLGLTLRQFGYRLRKAGLR
ncbi:MAG: sigma 54-interacting transcriptional regulator, partial [Hydrogenophaga sp.]|nr:sigma 54-interacting transcriptional regulator [Hydrogenophaga sp.]